MSSIKPALTAEEWEQIPQDTRAEGDRFWENAWGEQCERYETAARALYGQPFGFTREDVQLVRQKAREMYRSSELDGTKTGRAVYWGLARKWDSLADRIEALLPPDKI